MSSKLTFLKRDLSQIIALLITSLKTRVTKSAECAKSASLASLSGSRVPNPAVMLKNNFARAKESIHPLIITPGKAKRTIIAITVITILFSLLPTQPTNANQAVGQNFNSQPASSLSLKDNRAKVCNLSKKKIWISVKSYLDTTRGIFIDWIQPGTCTTDLEDVDGVWAYCNPLGLQTGCPPDNTTNKRLFKLPGYLRCCSQPAKYEISDVDNQSVAISGNYSSNLANDTYGWIFPFPDISLGWNLDGLPPYLDYSVYDTKININCGCTVNKDLISSIPIPTPPPLPTLPSADDQGGFVANVTLLDGSVVSPSQSLIKTWRLKNTGNTTWANNYQLVFTNGEQMGAPSTVNVPATAPNATADISINLIAPNNPGDHTGYWQLRNPQGTFFGPKIWVKITVPGVTSPPPSNDFSLTCLNCPAVVPPGQTFRPTLRATIGSGQLLQLRGDMARNTDGNLYGAWPQIAVVGTVNPGQPYDFTFYANNPITAPSSEGTYESKWRIWQNGTWVGPELTIRFQVQSGGGINRPPNTPTPSNPGEWATFQSPDPVTLQAQLNGDPDGDAITNYYFDVFNSHDVCNSSWITSNNWHPPCLGFWDYQWRVKVRDARGAESAWSETRHFNVHNPAITIEFFYVDKNPRAAWVASQPGQDKWVICGGATNTSALQYLVNTATDGSENGTWINVATSTGHDCVNDTDRPATLGQLEWESGQHRFRIMARGDQGGWESAATQDIVVDFPTDRRPGPPSGRFPLYNSYVNSRTVAFDWADTYRTTTYRLEASLNADFSGTPLLDVTLPVGTSAYTQTFSSDYPTIYWRVTSTGPYGTNQETPLFHIDLTPPSSAITPLPAVSYETNFSVNWSGTDSRSGLRWYQVQVRDGNRPDSQWADWLMNTTKTTEIFQGQTGHSYYFRVRAMDDVGNWEAWPAGDGDTSTVVDPTAAPLAPWWNLAYASKRNLVILNNDTDTIPVHYSMHVHFDNTTNPTATEIYNASLSAVKGNDIRVIYNNQQELDRFVQYFTANRIDIWFPLQAALGGGQTDSGSYQLYYGNSSAGAPPANVNTVFLPEADANTVGLWHFQDGSGSTVYDSSGRSHNGNFSSAGWADGYLGQAGSFNGIDSVVDLGTNADFNLTAMTLEAWIYLTGYPSSFPQVISKWGGSGGSYNLRITSDRTVEFTVGANGGNQGITSHQALDMNHWYHLAAVHDGGSNQWIYINGIEQGYKSDSRPALTLGNSLRIGRVTEWNGTAFPGYIQHARVSNIARHDFPYARIDVEPSIAAGSLQPPPATGSADLAVLNLDTYPNPGGGLLVQAVVENQGNLDTQNGFYTDLYLNNMPTGAGQYTGSLQFWVNDPIAAGATVTLTTVITDISSLGGMGIQALSASSEVTGTLYAQTDSTGAVSEQDNANNIYSAGTEICIASPDAYEGDETATAAKPIAVGQTQTHNFSSLSDQDWVTFAAQAGITYTLSTSNLGVSADTYLYVYDTDATTLLASNDDYGGSLASQLDWRAPTNGVYYILIEHWNPNVSGCGTTYNLNLQEKKNYKVYLPLIDRNIAPLMATATPTPTINSGTIATPTRTPMATKTATTTATWTQIPTATWTPTNTPMPTPTNTPTPTATPTLTLTPTSTVVPTPLGGWWNTGHAYRRLLPISTSGLLPTGMIIKVDGLDLETLVSQGKARPDHNDIRIVRRIGENSWQEVARAYYTGYDLEFQLPADIAPGSDTSYYLYYGNPSAGSPPTFSLPQGWWVDMYHDKWWTDYGGTWTLNQTMDFGNVCDPGLDHDGRIGSSFDESDKFRGRLFVPTTGVWTFRLYTNDGYGIYINGSEVGHFDGYDVNRSVTVGSMSLTAGWHQMELRNMWVNCGAWKFYLEGPSFSNQIVPANYFQQVWGNVKTGVVPGNEEIQ